MRALVCVALPVAVLVGAWVLRNWAVVGAPVLTTESGASFWYANNEWTFRAFPERSIDLAARASVANLDEERRATLDAAGANQVAVDRVLGSFGWAYVQSHPREVAIGAVRKVWVVLSGELSPARGGRNGMAYRLVYLSANLFALVGLVTAAHVDTRHSLLATILGAFLVTTAIYWAHTSHKSLIDAFVFVYASAAITRAWEQRYVERERADLRT